MTTLNTSATTPTTRKGGLRRGFLKVSEPIDHYGSLVLGVAALLCLITFGLSLFMGVSTSKVLTDSMEPSIMTGDWTVSQTIAMDEVAVGDVVNYYNAAERRTITHRIIELHADGSATTKGDNAGGADEMKVTAENLESKVVVTIHQPFASTMALLIADPEWRSEATDAVFSGEPETLATLENTPWVLVGGAALFLFLLLLGALNKLVRFTLRKHDA